MDEKIEKRRRSGFSPRMNVLRRMSGSDDPILSVTATYLTRNRFARRVGTIFELLFVIALPTAYIVSGIWMIIECKCLPLDVYAKTHGTIHAGRIPHLITEIAGLFMYAGFIVGSLMLVLPIEALLKIESRGELLRFLDTKPLNTLQSLLRLQFVSFVPWPFIACLFKAASYITWRFPMFGRLSDLRMRLIPSELISVLADGLAFMYFALVSIFVGMVFRSHRVSFFALLAMGLLYYFVVYLITLMPVRGDSWSTRLMIEQVIRFMATFVCLLAAAGLAYTATARRVMPSK